LDKTAEELSLNLCPSSDKGTQIKGENMDGACTLYGEDEECIQDFSRNTWKELRSW
jgi:hypothetical protein